MIDSAIGETFDAIMRNPESARGLDVESTAKLLAEAIRRRWPNEYEAKLTAMEEHYIEQFLHTAMALPGFVKQIHDAMRRFR